MTVLFSLTKPVGKLTTGLLIKNASFAFDKRGIDRLFRFILISTICQVYQRFLEEIITRSYSI